MPDIALSYRRAPVTLDAHAADLVILPEAGSDGDFITPTYLNANTFGGEPGTWQYTSGHTQTKVLKIRDGGISHNLIVRANGVTYAEVGTKRGQFDMESVWTARKTIASLTTGNPGVVNTATPHGFATGDFITIEANVGSTPTVNNTWTITVIDADSFSIDGLNLTVAGTGGHCRYGWDSFDWSPDGTYANLVMFGIMEFNAVGTEDQQISIDHWTAYLGSFNVLAQAITTGQFVGDNLSAGTVYAHGQQIGSTFGAGIEIVRGTPYLATLFLDKAHSRTYVVLQDAGNFEFVGASVAPSDISGDLFKVVLTNYLTPHGGTTDYELLALDWTHAAFPVKPFTLPAPTFDLQEQTDTDEITIRWTSGACYFLIERSVNGGSWSTLVAEQLTATVNEYVDTDVVDGSDYQYRVTASVASVASAPAMTAVITLDNGGSSIQPDDLAGLVVWFKADAGVEEANGDAAEDTDTVEFWRDQSVNGDDATRADGGTRPTYRTGILNGLPVLRFASKVIVSENAASPIGTVFVVVGNVTAVTAPAVFGVSQSSLARRVCTFYPDATTIYGGDGSEFFGTSFAVWVNGDSTNTFPGSGAYGVVTLRADSPASHDGSIAIGVSSVNDAFTGDIAELIAYDTSLDTSDRVGIETYLMTKYGLS